MDCTLPSWPCCVEAEAASELIIFDDPLMACAGLALTVPIEATETVQEPNNETAWKTALVDFTVAARGCSQLNSYDSPMLASM